MKTLTPQQLRQFLLDENLPGIVNILVWHEVDEESEAHAELTDVLFDRANGDVTRDLSDLKVRAGVVESALKHPEVAAAATRIFKRLRRPWWKFW